MKRGDIIRAALQGDYGKPRPAVIVQSDVINLVHPSIILCPITSELQDTPSYRITLEPSPLNGLHKISQIMIDKIQAIKRERCGDRIGALEPEQLLRLERLLLVVLGLA